MVGLDQSDHPLPEGKRLGVRIVHPEDLDTLGDPETHDIEQLGPEGLPIVSFEIKGVDVLVPFRRVLGVADTPVGKVTEPCRMLLHPWMIG